MKQKLPHSPFATRLSGSAKETELRLRSIFQWKKKRPPVGFLILAALIALSCGSLVSCQVRETPLEEEKTAPESPVVSPEEPVLPSEQESITGTRIQVIDLPWESKLLQEPMEGLTGEQKELLADLPVNELPREPVELRPSVSRGRFWRDTLIPLAADEGADVTLYGVVAGKSLTEDSVNSPTLSTDGIVLRSGDQAAYYPLSWGGNAWRRGNPWMSVRDYDGDGKNEAAVCFLVGTGSGVSVSNLYFFDLDAMTYTVPDYSAFGDIEVEYDPAAHAAILSCAADSLTVDVPEYLEPLGEVTCGNIVYFYEADGQIYCQVGLDFYNTVGYLAYAAAPVIWQDGGYRLGQITLSTKQGSIQ